MGELTSAGFVIRRLDEIVTRMDAGMRAIYGSDINTDPDSPDGQMIGIFSEALADLEELSGEMWRQMDPDYASGPNLDRIVAFAGIRRDQSAPSVLRSVILGGSPNIPIPADSVVYDQSGEFWRSLRMVTLNANGSARTDFQSVDSGAFAVGSNVELTISSGVTGWRSAVTSTASELGTNEETDPDLRARFYVSRERAADDDRAALEGNLRALNGVEDAVVYENYDDTIDAEGVNPHSINAVIEGGDPADIGNIILRLKPAGCGMQGATTVYIIDQYFRSRPIYFDRPTQDMVYVYAEVKRRSNFTDINEEGIKEEIAAQRMKIGEPVIRTELYAVMYRVPGFIVSVLRIGLDPAHLAEVDIQPGPREICVFDVANIEIVVV
jgi:uncharacterized phage protein gp47/JayE